MNNNNDFYRKIDVNGINLAVDTITKKFQKSLLDDLKINNDSKQLIEFFGNDNKKEKRYTTQYDKYIKIMQDDIKEKIYEKIKSGEQLTLKYDTVKNEMEDTKKQFIGSLQNLKQYAEKDSDGRSIGKSFQTQEKKIEKLQKKLDTKEFDNGYRETLLQSKAGLFRRIASRSARYRLKMQKIENDQGLRPEQKLVAFMKLQMKGGDRQLRKRFRFRLLYGKKGLYE